MAAGAVGDCVRAAFSVYCVHPHLWRKHAQTCYCLDPEQQQPGLYWIIRFSNYCRLGIVVVLDLDTERLSFQGGKEYKQQQSVLESNMEKMSKEKKKKKR